MVIVKVAFPPTLPGFQVPGTEIVATPPAESVAVPPRSWMLASGLTMWTLYGKLVSVNPPRLISVIWTGENGSPAGARCAGSHEGHRLHVVRKTRAGAFKGADVGRSRTGNTRKVGRDTAAEVGAGADVNQLRWPRRGDESSRQR